jgi:hypothetical protein
MRERCRRDSFAGSLGARRFNIMVMLRIGKEKTSMKTTLVAVLRLKNPKPPMAWKDCVAASNGKQGGDHRELRGSENEKLL